MIPAPGDILLDKYRVDELLGEGGFGVVLRATTLSSGRVVAIKVLKAGQRNQNTRIARFRREMRAIAKLSDPHTLTLYDYGETPAGALMMVTEYVEGQDLYDKLVARGTLDEDEVARILVQVLYSLREAHDAGLLHRDIKPTNIRLTRRDDGSLAVKVLDFGLAFSLDGMDDRLTATNTVVGTPRYMAPEQLLGEPLTAATDLYSVGVVAVAMLEGRPALRTKEIGKVTLSAHAGVSEELRAVIDQLLSPDPTKRYTSAAPVIHELRRILRSRRSASSVATPEPPPSRTASAIPVRDGPRARLFPTRTTQPYVRGGAQSSRRAVAVTAVALVGLFVAFAWNHRPPQPTRVSSAQLQVSKRSVRPPLEPEPAGEIALTGCGSDVEPGKVVVTWVGPGERVKFDVLVPASYDANVRSPLLVFVTPQHDPFARDLAEALGAVLLEPRSDWSTTRMLRMIDAAVEGLCVDDTRVLLYGQSTGLTALACELPTSVLVTNGAPRPHPACKPAHLHILDATRLTVRPDCDGEPCRAAEYALEEYRAARGCADRTPPARYGCCAFDPCTSNPLGACVLAAGWWEDPPQVAWRPDRPRKITSDFVPDTACDPIPPNFVRDTIIAFAKFSWN